MIFYYVRHGDPIYDPDSLTPLGHEQAKAVAKRFTIYGLDEVYASTSNRAMQTAEPTCKLLNKEMQLCPWANEGRAWELFTVPKNEGGRAWAFFHDETVSNFRKEEVRAMGKKWYEHELFADSTFARGVQTVDKSCDEFFEKLGYRHDRRNNCYVCLGENKKRVALFAHQGFGMAFFSSVLDVIYPVFATTFDCQHSGVSVIYFDDNAKEGDIVVPKLLQLSNDSHLYHENLLTPYNYWVRL
ncbi:MAG: histidine phosphatase family protein [Clostridia bacterium]|nr:histidine phosphatase family protein [Clostridia bacterium]